MWNIAIIFIPHKTLNSSKSSTVKSRQLLYYLLPYSLVSSHSNLHFLLLVDSICRSHLCWVAIVIHVMLNPNNSEKNFYICFMFLKVSDEWFNMLFLSPIVCFRVNLVSLQFSEEFNSGFGSHTPMILGQAKVIRYYQNYERWYLLLISFRSILSL